MLQPSADACMSCEQPLLLLYLFLSTPYCIPFFSLAAIISSRPTQNFPTPPLLPRHAMSRPNSASTTALWRWPRWSRVWRWRWSCCVWQGWRTSSRPMSGPPWRFFAMQALRSGETDGLTLHSSNKQREHIKTWTSLIRQTAISIKNKNTVNLNNSKNIWKWLLVDRRMMIVIKYVTSFFHENQKSDYSLQSNSGW